MAVTSQTQRALLRGEWGAEGQSWESASPLSNGIIQKDREGIVRV